MVWEAIFLLAVLKIPVIYVCLVVWWAIRAEPRHDGLEPATLRMPPQTDPRPGTHWRRSPGPRGHGPHGRPLRTYRRREAFASARVGR